MIQVTSNEVKKDLYKSKVNAKFSHYAGGKLFYNVELSDGSIHQFPINTVESKKKKLVDLLTNVVTTSDAQKSLEDILGESTIKLLELADDLGNTPFGAEIKASELNRWINKAIESGDFICINRAPVVEETYDERSNLGGTV